MILSRAFALDPHGVILSDHHFGTAGLVRIASKSSPALSWIHPVAHVRWLAFGFNSSFEPAVLLSQEKFGFNNTGRTAYEWFQKAFKHPAGSKARYRSLIFNDNWISCVGSEESIDKQWRRRHFLVLAGDRLKGIEKSLEMLDLNISIKRCPDHGMLMGSSSPNSRPRDVWTVDISTSQEALGQLDQQERGKGICGC